MNFLGLILLFNILTSPNYSSQIQIEIIGINEFKGNLMVAVFDQEKGFGNEKYAFHKQVNAIEQNIEVSIGSNYQHKPIAFAIYQDVNKNGILDKNFLGLPTEPYGFSNNVKGYFGPPSFSEASIHFEEKLLLKIELN